MPLLQPQKFWFQSDFPLKVKWIVIVTIYFTPTADQKYYAYGNQRDSGPVVTDHKFTGQKHDNTGLYYYNARYYDPELGTFISPDTIVPDPALVSDYNRYLYVRGNPLKYSDPTGHYSDDEIMTHFGCDDWICVEDHFGEGGSHAGMWGWLHILQQARDGDSVVARGVGSHSYAEMAGTFQLGANGQIELHGGSYTYASGVHKFSDAAPEVAFAGFAGNFGYADFTLSGPSMYAFAQRSQMRTYLYFDPAQIDKGGLALAGLKAGADVGPTIMASSAASGPAGPGVFTVGLAYTMVGGGTVLAVDVIAPVVQAVNGNSAPALEVIGVELTSRVAGETVSGIAPYVGPTYDVGKALAPGFCYGTGCRR